MKNCTWFYTLIIVGISMFSCGKKDANNDQKKSADVTDTDGNIYHTINIGTQTWMVENLKVTHYRNGDEIPNITDWNLWSSQSQGAYCNYNNEVANAAIYGHLYNGYTINDSRILAPVGWHIPTDAEWTTLVTYLGGEDAAGGRMKEPGTIHWSSPNAGTTNNNSGFTGVPGGLRDSYGGCYNIGQKGEYWSSSINGGSNPYCWYLLSDQAYIIHTINSRIEGCSVRCIKDN